jgi:type IV fimbrial biogenesis protein FimT
MQKQRGFTLIELLVVLVIAAVLVTLAAPSFRKLIESNSMSSGVNSFMSDLRYARSESIRRGGGVVMCRSDAPEATTPVCGSGTGPGGKGWVSGWIVFQDLNTNGDIDANEPILRVQAAFSSIDSILESGSSSSTKFNFTATGRLHDSGSATGLTFGGSTFSSDLRRIVCVSLGGRARIAGDGSTSCGSGSE